ncbi:MAG TPA: cupin domain-containing protein, partial [Polyangiaceae bacterium LLY-WYZ-15_(1-7)]|nr:cupin domain-containing protein [Polyangiaceae bacterium LLY-WYZ-15_(1-7)]
AEEDGGEASLASTETLPFAGGKLRVQILLDAARGARHAAFSLLDGDADLPVPPHVHEGSVEALFIVSGDGTMLRGDERFPIAPGRVVIVPAGVRHGYEAGTEPLRAYQIYHPPGPEQRFRASAPATPPAPTEEP